MSSLPSGLAAVQFWPIAAKGAVTRLNPLGDPTIEQYYHKAMEQGRVLECSIADANNWLLQKKQQIYADIAQYTRMQSIATNGQLKYTPRVIKLANDVSQCLKTITTFQQEVASVIMAMEQNVQMLATIEHALLQEVTTALNSLANLLQNICNWGLPKLPSLPNLLADGMFNWNGFNFSPLSNLATVFKPNLPNLSAFSNFSFSNCTLASLGLVNNPNTNNPSQVSQYSGNTLGTPTTVVPLPLNGVLPSSGTSLQQTVIPVYDPTTYNPNTGLVGSLPNPTNIISDYQLPPATYQANILSLIPVLQSQVIVPGDSDYNNPDLAVRQPIEQKALSAYVTLGNVVSSDYDPYVLSAWLFYLSLNFAGRGGEWIENFEILYNSVIQPSVNYLANNPVPFNNYTGTVVDTPTAIPFLATIQAVSPAALQNLLWKLSYIEASLLGYTRNKTWDSGSDSVFVSNFTGTDLDYAAETISTTTTTVTLGATTAAYPVPCTFPTSFASIMAQAIDIATANIAAAQTYLSTNPANRYIYNQFAEAVMVDKYSQFWRDFNTNVVILLAQDPYILARVASYPETLDGVLDPLASAANIADYQAVLLDCQTRNRSWVPGSDLLNLPIAPITSYNNPVIGPANGWNGSTFDTAAYLSRPDIQSLPIPVQMAMLRTNISYAGIMQFSQALQAEIATQTAALNAAIAGVAQTGFQVSSTSLTTTVPTGDGTPVEFDTTSGNGDFDITGNVSLPSTFTIQTGGVYAITGNVTWAATPGTLTVVVNGVPLYQTSDAQFVTSGAFSVGDVVQLIATTETSTTIAPGSVFGMLLTTPVASSAPTAPPAPVTTTGNASQTYTAGANFPALTAVLVYTNGDVIPVDPTISKPGPPFPYVDGVALTAGVTGQPVSVATTYGGSFQVAGSSFTTGVGFYVGTGGLLQQSNPSLTWTIYVGMATSADTFLFEPHVPQ